MGRMCVWIGVAVLAVICGVFGSRENCGEDRVTECKEKLLEIIFGDLTLEEGCEQLYGVSKCLRNVVDDCLGEDEELPPDVENSLKQFESILDDNCAGDAGDEDEVDKCLQENQDYLLECIIDEESGGISKLLQPESIPDSIDLEFAKCYLYGLMAHCVVGRSEEMCGAAGGERAADEMNDLPPSVQESCDSQQESVETSGQEVSSANLLGQRKKRQPEYNWQVEYRKKRAPEPGYTIHLKR